MKRLAITSALLLLCAGSAWAWGSYSYYGGGATATASGWNGGGTMSWSWAPSWWGWGWGGGCYAYTYATTYGPGDPKSQWSWGWGGASAQSHSANGGRTADAWANAYNAGWGWWNCGGYAWARAQTSGVPSFATATAHANSWWRYQYWVPWAWWNQWVAYHGWYVPYYLRWYYWGWFDPDTVSFGAFSHDNISEEDLLLMNEGWRDNGDGTFTHVGSTNILNPSDLSYSTNVGGTGHAGWNIYGHDGSQGQDPYEMLMMMKARQIGDDGQGNVLIETDFTQDWQIGIPEPSSLLALCAGLIGAIGAFRRRK